MNNTPVKVTQIVMVPVVATHEDGSTETVNVHQLRVSQYMDAFESHENEFEFVGVVCERDKAWVLTLFPASFEELFLKATELNAGFLTFADRKIKAISDKVRRMSPETLRAAKEALQAARPV